jgi:hypothetical protein
MLELMGGKKIDILQSTAGDLVDSGFIMQGRVDPDIAGALGAMGDMQGSIQSIGTQADTLLRNANSVLGDQQFIAALKEAVLNLQAVSGELRGYVSRNSGNLDRLTVNLTALSTRADTMLEQLQPRLLTTLDKTDRLLGSADTLAGDIRSLLADVRDSRGLLHTAVFDTTLAQRFDAMLLKLDSISSIIINKEFTTKISLF